MKIHITLNEPAIEGYFHASPKNLLFDGDYSKLDKYCYVGQCDEIYAPAFLDYLEYEKIPNVIASWVSLLRMGGKLIVGGLDSYIVTKLYISRNIDQNKINDLFFGKEFLVKSLNSIQDIKELLIGLNMSIYTIDVDVPESRFVIEAHKQ